jgi:hypothetical protein
MEVISILASIVAVPAAWLLGRHFGRIKGHSAGFAEGYAAGTSICRDKVRKPIQKKMVKPIRLTKKEQETAWMG